MPYDIEQLLAWFQELSSQLPPRGTSSFAVDREAGVLHLALQPDHDVVAVQSFLGQLPADAVRVEVADARWYGQDPGATPGTPKEW